MLTRLASLPDSIKRVGVTDAFPDEYPGQIYAFNWCLNGDGVTPLRKSAFRITKPLDIKVAGLQPAKKTPLKVNVSFETYLPLVEVLVLYLLRSPIVCFRCFFV